MRSPSATLSRLTCAATCISFMLAVAACDSTSDTPTGTPTPAGIGVLGGSAQAAIFGTALPLPLEVHVTDQYGNGIGSVQVTFAATGGAPLATSTATTDSSGNAETTVTLGTGVGVDSITATVTGADVPARFTETSLAGPATAITIVSGNGQSGVSGTALPLPFVLMLSPCPRLKMPNAPISRAVLGRFAGDMKRGLSAVTIAHNTTNNTKVASSFRMRLTGAADRGPGTWNGDVIPQIDG